MKTNKEWVIYEKLPEGFSIEISSESPPHGYVFISDGKSVLSGGVRALMKLEPKNARIVDKPFDNRGDSSQPTVPISVIVDGITSASVANEALRAAGMLERRFRETSNGKTAFWSVTEKGAKYGKNLVSPSNSRKTQPHWYACKSDEIVKIVIDNLGKVQ